MLEDGPQVYLIWRPLSFYASGKRWWFQVRADPLRAVPFCAMQSLILPSPPSRRLLSVHNGAVAIAVPAEDMNDARKTKEQLIEELEGLHGEISNLRALSAGGDVSGVRTADFAESYHLFRSYVTT